MVPRSCQLYPSHAGGKEGQAGQQRVKKPLHVWSEITNGCEFHFDKEQVTLGYSRAETK